MRLRNSSIALIIIALVIISWAIALIIFSMRMDTTNRFDTITGETIKLGDELAWRDQYILFDFMDGTHAVSASPVSIGIKRVFNPDKELHLQKLNDNTLHRARKLRLRR